MPDYSLILSFPDQSESFVLGYEAGLVGAEAETGQAVIERTVHTTNAEMFRRMGAAYGYKIDLKPTSVPGWSDLTMTAYPKRGHLSVTEER